MITDLDPLLGIWVEPRRQLPSWNRGCDKAVLLVQPLTIGPISWLGPNYDLRKVQPILVGQDGPNPCLATVCAKHGA